MAAATLPKPGSKYGPCKGKCAHIDCAQTRQMSAETCRFCGDMIGYDKRFYTDLDNRDKLVHAVCLEESVEQERKAVKHGT